MRAAHQTPKHKTSLLTRTCQYLQHLPLLQGIFAYVRRHPRQVTYLMFFGLWLACALIFYFRFPNNFHYANFFAEDGQHFVKNIMEKGPLDALLTTFNGYYIFGIYILTDIGFALNWLFFNNEFINLPASLAATSYIFLGLCCVLPFLLLRSYVPRAYLAGTAIVLALMPFPSFDYGIIGVIGNLKFPFLFIAILLIMYRATLAKTAKRVFAVDALLALCAYTTVTVYLLLPFLLLCDGLRPKQLFNFKRWREHITPANISLISAVILALVVVIQLVVIAVNGIPRYPGYLDEPYQPAKTIEIFLGRTFLYPVVAWGYHHLNDIIVVLLFAAFIGCIAFYGRRKNWWWYGLGIFGALAASAVFIVNRTGVSFHYNNYLTSGFDNFFYTQNFIFVVLCVLLAYDLARRLAFVRRFWLVPLAFAVVIAGELYANHSYAPNDFMQYQISTLRQQAKTACATSDAKDITFSVYPFTFLTMTEPRDTICTPSHTQPVGLQNFNLAPTENMPLNIFGDNPVATQTFTAEQPNLRAVAVYLSTYYQTRLQGYTFRLYDKTCTHPLREVAMPYKVRDNSYVTIPFTVLPNSKGTAYCFSITPDKPTSPKLALQLSAANAYPYGELRLTSQPQTRDIVFYAVYAP